VGVGNGVDGTGEREREWVVVERVGKWLGLLILAT
jgi:hypothetical protein